VRRGATGPDRGGSAGGLGGSRAVGGKGIPCRQRGAAAGVAGGWWTRLAEAAATCKRNEDEANSAVTAGGRLLGAMVASSTVDRSQQ
jgi:hypothetical protein